MHIDQLIVWANDLRAQRHFYESVLGLSVRATVDQLVVRAGDTRLIFQQARRDWSGVYHFAFNIPENKFKESKDWLQARTPLIRDEAGRDEFDFQEWQAHGLYFYDAAGNIAEFVARHTLPNASAKPFSPESILCVSEIGIVVEDVRASLLEYQTTFGIQLYGEPSDTFAPLGDENGLLIVVKRGRNWAPDTFTPADIYPTTVVMRTPLGERLLVHTQLGLK